MVGTLAGNAAHARAQPGDGELAAGIEEECQDDRQRQLPQPRADRQAGAEQYMPDRRDQLAQVGHHLGIGVDDAVPRALQVSADIGQAAQPFGQLRDALFHIAGDQRRQVVDVRREAGAGVDERAQHDHRGQQHADQRRQAAAVAEPARQHRVRVPRAVGQDCAPQQRRGERCEHQQRAADQHDQRKDCSNLLDQLAGIH
ncbi:hypothetical protein D3C72_1545110 [compost metagenome]